MSTVRIIAIMMWVSMNLAVFGQELPGSLRLKQLKTAAECRHAMISGDAILRRAAFRKLLTMRKELRPALLAGTRDCDPAIRSRSIYEYCRLEPDAAVPIMLQMVKADDQQTLTALALCCSMAPPSADREKLRLALLSQAKDSSIKKRVVALIGTFNFFRVNQRLKDTPGYDMPIKLLRQVRLPPTGWRFNTDPAEDGHLKGYMKPAFNDDSWARLNIGNWESQGFNGYDGIGWYRISFAMPEKIDGVTAVELVFEGVDESAWVWLNGIYIGQHDIGANGWNVPFGLSVTSEIKWGAENLLAVRVRDSAYNGGIWKPVSVEILK